MNIKKKLCDGCGEHQFIWKNSEGKRYCKQCWSAHKSTIKPKPTAKQKPIPSRSPKRSREEKIYSGKRIIFLSAYPMCQAHISGICTQRATDVHHKFSGSDRSKYFLDETTWLAICRACHNWIHANSQKAREKDLLN